MRAAHAHEQAGAVVARHGIGPRALHVQHVFQRAALAGGIAKDHATEAGRDGLRALGNHLGAAQQFVGDQLPQRRIDPGGDHERFAHHDRLGPFDSLDGQVAGRRSLDRPVVDAHAGGRRTRRRRGWIAAGPAAVGENEDAARLFAVDQ